MSLRIYSTKREKMKLITLVTKRASTKGKYKDDEMIKSTETGGKEQPLAR